MNGQPEENEGNIVSTAQLSFRLDEALRRRFLGKVKGSGLTATAILEEFVRDYVREDREENQRGALAPQSPRQLPGFTDEEFEALCARLRQKDAGTTVIRGMLKGIIADYLEGKSKGSTFR